MDKTLIKKRRKKICLVCILSICLQLPVTVTAEIGKIWTNSSLNGVSFREISDNGWMVCAYEAAENPGTSLNIAPSYAIIPTYIGETVQYKMRGIEDGVFATQENGINQTFSRISIKASEEITIGNSAFEGVQVQGNSSDSDVFTITGGKLERIGESAFENAKINGNFIINSFDECIIGENAFRNAVINGRLMLSGSIDTLGDYALSNLTLKGISLPNTIRHMGDGVFYNTNMTGATFPLNSSLESIGSRVFVGTGLQAIQLPEENHLTSVAEDAFSGIDGTTIIIPPTADVNILNIYHITVNQNLIIQLPADLPEGSDIEIYVQQNGFVYQKGESGETIEPVPAATPSPTPSPTPTATPTLVPSPTPTATPTLAPSPTPTATPTLAPSPTPTATPTLAPSPTPTATPTLAPSPTPTATPTLAPSPTPTATPALAPSPTPTATPSLAPSPTPTATPALVPSPTPTANPTLAPSPTPTANPTLAPPPAPTATPKTKVYQVKKLKYEITGKNQVAVTGTVSGKDISITIPNTVKIQGRLYRVTKIKARAFRGKKRLKRVTVGDYVKDIGAQAFARCPRLTKIQFGTGLISMGKKTLYRDSGLRTIIFKGKKLKKIGKKTFSGISPKKVSIKVKKVKMKAYQKLILKAK